VSAVHVLFQVLVHVLKHEDQLVIGVDDIVETARDTGLSVHRGQKRVFRYRTMLSCRSSFMREISRMAVDGAPSSLTKRVRE